MDYIKHRFRKENQDFINFIISSLSYITIVFLFFIYIRSENILPQRIPFLDALLILLATLRLTQFFVYDKSMRFFRDLFVDIKGIVIKNNEIEIKKALIPFGLRRFMYDLFTCPWCTSIWIATFIIFGYFLFPSFWILIFIFAISGAASIIQIATNAIGWTSERIELEVVKEEKKN